MSGARRFILPGLIAVVSAVAIVVVVSAPGGDPGTSPASLGATTSASTGSRSSVSSTSSTTSTTPEPSPPAGGVINIHTRLMPYVPAQTTWTHVGVGVVVTARVNTAAPGVGEPVHFDIEVSSTAGPCCAVWFRPGELPPGEERSSCLPGEPRGPGTVAFGHTHAYATAGRFGFTVTGFTGTCTAPGAVASFTGHIAVG